MRGRWSRRCSRRVSARALTGRRSDGPGRAAHDPLLAALARLDPALVGGDQVEQVLDQADARRRRRGTGSRRASRVAALGEPRQLALARARGADVRLADTRTARPCHSRFSTPGSTAGRKPKARMRRRSSGELHWRWVASSSARRRSSMPSSRRRRPRRRGVTGGHRASMHQRGGRPGARVRARCYDRRPWPMGSIDGALPTIRSRLWPPAQPSGTAIATHSPSVITFAVAPEPACRLFAVPRPLSSGGLAT